MMYAACYGGHEFLCYKSFLRSRTKSMLHENACRRKRKCHSSCFQRRQFASGIIADSSEHQKVKHGTGCTFIPAAEKGRHRTWEECWRKTHVKVIAMQFSRVKAVRPLISASSKQITSQLLEPNKEAVEAEAEEMPCISCSERPESRKQWGLLSFL